MPNSVSVGMLMMMTIMMTRRSNQFCPHPTPNKIKKSPGDRSSRYATAHDSTITVALEGEKRGGGRLQCLNSALIRSLTGTTELVYRYEILHVWSMKEEWSTYGFVYMQ